MNARSRRWFLWIALLLSVAAFLTVLVAERTPIRVYILYLALSFTCASAMLSLTRSKWSRVLSIAGLILAVGWSVNELVNR
jgi:hypothetical protein